MIDLYTWATPNGHKVHILLEELGLPYTVFPVNIRAGEQFEESFLEISPNNRIPAMIDRDSVKGDHITIFESGAMLIYLAEKMGRFLPGLENPKGRSEVLQWLMWQMGGIGPMFGQASHFREYAREREPPDRLQYGIDRYTNGSRRLCRVLDKRLDKRDYLAGEYPIADMAVWPWCREPGRRGVDPNDFSNVRDWFDRVADRPAVKRAIKVLSKESVRPKRHDDQAWSIMFGDKQFHR